MKIKKNDNVIIVAGKDRGKTGKVILAIPEDSKVVVEGINLRKIHQRPRAQGKKGEIIERASPIHVSNVMIVDPKTNKASRIGYKIEGDKKVRVSKKSGQSIGK